MSTKDLKALERRTYEEANKGKAAFIARADEVYATNIVFHTGIGTDIRGRKDVKQYFSAVYDALPDGYIVIDDMIVEGDKLTVRWTLTGTHKGELMGIPPTNKKVTLWGIDILRFAGSKLVEFWSTSDHLGLMQQLGVIPTSGMRK
jgi:predicted ester cyclase